MHTHRHRHIWMYRSTHIHSHIPTSPTYLQYIHTYTYTNDHMHFHKHIHTCVGTLTHAHTHALLVPAINLQFGVHMISVIRIKPLLQHCIFSCQVPNHPLSQFQKNKSILQQSHFSKSLLNLTIFLQGIL